MLGDTAMVASTSSFAVLTAAVTDDRDLRQLVVPYTFTGGSFVFGEEYWTAT